MALWKTPEALEMATLERVSWFNRHRQLEDIGYIPPAEAEANYYRQLAEQAMSAHSNQRASTKPGAVQSGEAAEACAQVEARVCPVVVAAYAPQALALSSSAGSRPSL
jgi:hypothetical protein